MPLRYSIIIPVFNRSAMTQHCLRTLPASIVDAGEGEVIVVDNASSDDTPAVLGEFPWTRIIRNERNRGFAAANNQGAAIATGRTLVLLNNDTEAKPGWLATMLAIAEAPDVGAVGARLLFPDGTLQHAGVVFSPVGPGSAGFIAQHDCYKQPGTLSYASQRRAYQAVTAACLATPRELYLELGGLDEGFWNGYEDVDYCLKVGSRGLNVIQAGDAVLTHFESQSGAQRYRRVLWNVQRLGERWGGKVTFDANDRMAERATALRRVRLPQEEVEARAIRVPATTIVAHGDAALGNDPAVLAMLRANDVPIAAVRAVASADAVAAVRLEMELRGDRYLALVDTRARLQPGWLDRLVAAVEYGPEVGAATFAPEAGTGTDLVTYAADARCTLLALAQFPQDRRLRDRGSLDAAVAEFLSEALELRVVTRAISSAIGVLPPANVEPTVYATDPTLREPHLRSVKTTNDTLVSIVMLSWNALEYTKIALESIRRHTRAPYEVIIVDNGSERETVDWLSSLDDVTVIFNERNRGYAAGNNQGLAAASGEFAVILNNDVVVTEGWIEGLLDPFERIPSLGISAPRSNKVAGVQQVTDASYDAIEAMHRYAEQRRKRYAGSGFMLNRVIGLCMCVHRRVIEEVGGIDERFGVGNFEDDDFCLRVRAAGYRIYVCEDVFIHHFGSQTFAANKIDWQATMSENRRIFGEKWSLMMTDTGYDPTPAIARGFLREKHYVPLPHAQTGPPPRRYRVAFFAAVQDEPDWNEVGAFARRYMRAFRADDAVLFAIAAAGTLAGYEIGDRLHRLAQREGIAEDAVADIDVCERDAGEEWRAEFSFGRAFAVGAHLAGSGLAAVEQTSPSALRRLLAQVEAS